MSEKVGNMTFPRQQDVGHREEKTKSHNTQNKEFSRPTLLVTCEKLIGRHFDWV